MVMPTTMHGVARLSQAADVFLLVVGAVVAGGFIFLPDDGSFANHPAHRFSNEIRAGNLDLVVRLTPR
jgi:hypothetical protein